MDSEYFRLMSRDFNGTMEIFVEREFFENLIKVKGKSIKSLCMNFYRVLFYGVITIIFNSFIRVGNLICVSQHSPYPYV